MAEAALALLWSQAQVFTGALILVALLRGPFRRFCGAEAAFWVWSLVPALAGAALWPRAWSPLATEIAGPGLLQPLPALSGAALLPSAPLAFAAPLWLGAWALGLVAVLAWLVRGQRRLHRLLMADAPMADAVQGAWRLPAGHSPALVGLWRPRLALPLDFDTRFSADERRAILQHEAAHARRRDNLWILLAHGWLALFWFHPLAWWALRRLRADQELACDAAVLGAAGAPDPRDYARALLKAQQAGAFWPASQWRSTHPLIERIQMLHSHRLSSMRRRAGHGLAAALSAAALVSGPLLHAAPPADAQQVMVYLTLEQDGRPFAQPRLFGGLGQPMSLRWQTDAAAGWPESWDLRLSTSQLADGRLQFETRLSRGQPLVPMAQPRLVAAAGEPARLEVRSDDGRHSLSITLMARLAERPDLRRP